MLGKCAAKPYSHMAAMVTQKRKNGEKYIGLILWIYSNANICIAAAHPPAQLAPVLFISSLVKEELYKKQGISIMSCITKSG